MYKYNSDETAEGTLSNVKYSILQYSDMLSVNKNTKLFFKVSTEL